MKTETKNTKTGQAGQTYEVVDLFCGAGGSSTGARKAIEEELGGRMILRAINHWNIAVQTHAANHPDAMHVVEDVNIVDPETVVPDRYLDLLMASPECKFHSRARGGKPISDQGRMSAWAILNWLDKLDVQNILIENVPEFVDWGPLDQNRKPDKAKKGLHFQTWFFAIQSLGYQAEWRMLNAADYGDATTRVRFFLMARKDGKPVRWPEPTHAKGDTGMFPGRLPWRGAREIINWDDLGRSLMDDPKYRKKPLSVKTRQRIARGLERFGGPLAPLYIRLLDLQDEPESADPGWKETGKEPGKEAPLNRHGENGSDGAHALEDPAPTAAARSAGRLAQKEGEPFVGANRNNNVPKGTEEPVPPVTTGGGLYVVRPEAEPFMIGQHTGSSPKSTEDPAPTITTRSKIRLFEPTAREFLLGQQSGSAARSTDNPAPTVSGAGAISLVRPAIIQFYGQSVGRAPDDPLSTVTSFNKHGLASPVLIEYYSHGNPHSVDQPVGTVTTKDRHALATPALLEVNHGNGPQGERGNSRRVHSADGPLPAITASPGLGICQPTLVELNHQDGEQDRKTPSLDEPVGSPTTRRGLGLAWPILVQTGQTGGNGGYSRPVEQPAPVLTTKNDTHIVTPGGEPFVVPNFGEREGQEPRSHDLRMPAPSVTSRGAGSMVSPTIARAGSPGEAPEEEDAENAAASQETAQAVLDQAFRENVDPRRIVFIDGQPYLLDIRFRMLQNGELARAMGFDDEETQYEFAGNVTEVTKQIGNAVPVHLAAALVGAILAGPDAGDAGENPQ